MSSAARPMFFVRYAAGSKLTVKEDIFSVSPSRAAFSRVTSRLDPSRGHLAGTGRRPLW